MNHNIAVFTATTVTLWLLYRVATIVRESASEAAHDMTTGQPLSRAVLDGVLHAAGRLTVLLGTALAITCAITLAHRPAPTPKVDIVRLEPVVVTISAQRYAEIQAQASESTRLAARPAQLRG